MWYSSENCFNTPSTVGFVSMQVFPPAACGRHCIDSQLLKSEKSAFQKGQSISSRRELRRRRLAWILLVGYGLVASGLPLPVGVSTHAAAHTPAGKRLAVKDRSRPFPCMDKPCGCASAEQCFANCCCSTPRERLAWARSHRVEPAVVASLERRISQETPQLESLQNLAASTKIQSLRSPLKMSVSRLFQRTLSPVVRTIRSRLRISRTDSTLTVRRQKTRPMNNRDRRQQ